MQKPFEGIFGNSCDLRVIDFMLPLEGLEYNLTELEEEMGVSRQTLSKIMKKHEEWGLVKTRIKGNATYYSINERDPLVKTWVQMNNVIIGKMLTDDELYEIRDCLNYRPAKKPEINAAASSLASSPNAGLSSWAGDKLWGHEIMTSANPTMSPAKIAGEVKQFEGMTPSCERSLLTNVGAS